MKFQRTEVTMTWQGNVILEFIAVIFVFLVQLFIKFLVIPNN